jgi:hypothetical protein
MLVLAGILITQPLGRMFVEVKVKISRNSFGVSVLGRLFKLLFLSVVMIFF